MKQKFWIAVLLFVLSTNVVACVKEDPMPALPPTTNEPSTPDNDKNEDDLIETISPRPILFIVGSKADTIYFSQTAYDKASEPKELFYIDKATHVDLYDKSPFVEQVTEKLATFFGKNL